MKFTKKDLQTCATMLKQLTAAEGIAGREQNAVQAATQLMHKLGLVDIATTRLGSLYGFLPAQNLPPNAPLVLLEAHIDQVGLVVTGLEGGFLRIANCGGIDRRLLPSFKVAIKAQTGVYTGVVCSVPPHLKGDDKTPPKMEDMFIDTGFDAKKAAQLFAAGDTVTVPATALELGQDCVTGAALDDRAGCAAVLRAAQLLMQQGCTRRVAVLLASMEEVGGQGAATATALLQPDCAYAVDVSFASGIGIPPHKCGQLAQGTMIGFAPVLSRQMSQDLVSLAKAHKVPYQCEIMGGTTGTDADKMVLAAQGVPCALLSIPLRNMHTAAELLSLTDVEATAQLIALAVQQTKEVAHG